MVRSLSRLYATGAPPPAMSIAMHRRLVRAELDAVRADISIARATSDSPIEVSPIERSDLQVVTGHVEEALTDSGDVRQHLPVSLKQAGRRPRHLRRARAQPARLPGRAQRPGRGQERAFLAVSRKLEPQRIGWGVLTALLCSASYPLADVITEWIPSLARICSQSRGSWKLALVLGFLMVCV